MTEKEKIKKIKSLNKNIIRKDGSVETFKEQIFDLMLGKFKMDSVMIISEESKGLSYISGIEAEKILIIRANKVMRIMMEHGLGIDELPELKELIDNSVLAFDSLTQESSRVVVLDRKDSFNNQLIAICRTDALNNWIEVNQITSVYGKKNFVDFLQRTFEEDKNIYCNKKTKRFFEIERLQLPNKFKVALSCFKYKGSFKKSQAEEKMKKEKSIQKDLELENDEEIEKLENELDKELNENSEVLEDTKKFKNLDFEDLEF